MPRLTANAVLPSTYSTTPPSSPPQLSPSTPPQTSPQPHFPINLDLEPDIDIELILDDATRFLSSSSPSVEAPASSPNIIIVATQHHTPPSSIAASSPTKRRVTFPTLLGTPSKTPWFGDSIPQHLPTSRQRKGFVPKSILKIRSPPRPDDPIAKMSDALTVLASSNRDRDIILAQYIGLQDVMRMVDECPQIDALLPTSKKDLLRFVARDMVAQGGANQLDLNLARKVVELLPLLVNRPGFEDGVVPECANILDLSLDFLEDVARETFSEQPGLSDKSRQSQQYQLSNLTTLHLQFWISQKLSKSLDDKHVRRMASMLEKFWQKAEDAQKARHEDPLNNTESTFEKATSVQARLNVLQKLLQQAPIVMTREPKRWLRRLLEETLSRYPEVRKTATDVGTATALDMGARKEIAQAILSIMNNPSKMKDRTYVQRRIAALDKRLNGKDTDKNLLPDTWVVPLMYMRNPDVKSLAWVQLATYRNVLRDCFELKDREMKLACWEALRKLISSEFEGHHNTTRLEEFWHWMNEWIPVCFGKVKKDSDWNSPVFLSAVYTYLRLLQKAIPTSSVSGKEYLDRAWQLCVKDVMTTLHKKGKTRTHKFLACRVLAALFGDPQIDNTDDVWAEHQEFGAGCRDIQPFAAEWVRSHLAEVNEVLLPFLEYDILGDEASQATRTEIEDTHKASMRMWVALLRTVSAAGKNMDFTSSGRRELSKVMANITNLLTSLWKSIISSTLADSAVPRFFSLLSAAMDILSPGNFAQNYLYSINGGICDAASPSTQKGQKPQSCCMVLTTLMVKALFSKPKLCENGHMLSPLGLIGLWSRCLESRSSPTQQLEFLQSLSETVYKVIQREDKGKGASVCKPAHVLYKPILKFATDTFPVSGAVSDGPTALSQPYRHSQRILEIALGCTTPDGKQVQDLYAAMVSSIKAEGTTRIQAEPYNEGQTGRASDAGAAGIAILLTVPHAKMVLSHLNEARPSQLSQKFLIDYALMIIKHDTRPSSREAFKQGRDFFWCDSHGPKSKTIDLHCVDFHRMINKAISTLYGPGDGSFKPEAMRTNLIDTLIAHLEQTPTTQQSIVTFIQAGISLLLKDPSLVKAASAEKVDKLWNIISERMDRAVSSDTQKWLKEHDALVAAGLSSPHPAISIRARDFCHKWFHLEELPLTSDVVKALKEPKTAVGSGKTSKLILSEGDESDSTDDLPEPTHIPATTSAPRNFTNKPAPLLPIDLNIPSSPPGQQQHHGRDSPKKQPPSPLLNLSRNAAPDHMPSTPIIGPGLDEENVPSSPIISSEHRRSLNFVSRTPRAPVTINSSQRFADGETIPSSPPAYIQPEQLKQQTVNETIEEDDASSVTGRSQEPLSSAALETSNPAKRGRGRPRKVNPEESIQEAYMDAYHWRERFDKCTPRPTSCFTTHPGWMETAKNSHEHAAFCCNSIEKFFGCAPFEIWPADHAPSHWGQSILERLSYLTKISGMTPSETASKVHEARKYRVETPSGSFKTTRVNVEDIIQVIEDLESTDATNSEPTGKRKREDDSEITSSPPGRMRKRAKFVDSTPSQAWESQHKRYPRRDRSTPYKPESAVANLKSKVMIEKTPKTPGWRGWAYVAPSPEPAPEAEENVGQTLHAENPVKEEARDDGRQSSRRVRRLDYAQLSGKQKRGRTNEADEDEDETGMSPADKRRKLDPPSTPSRSEVRSDPVVKVTPGDRAGQGKNAVGNPATETAQRSTAGASIGAGIQRIGSPAPWLRKFKELLMEVPTYLWRPRDHTELTAASSELWERVWDNSLRE